MLPECLYQNGDPMNPMSFWDFLGPPSSTQLHQEGSGAPQGGQVPLPRNQLWGGRKEGQRGRCFRFWSQTIWRNVARSMRGFSGGGHAGKIHHLFLHGYNLDGSRMV